MFNENENLKELSELLNRYFSDSEKVTDCYSLYAGFVNEYGATIHRAQMYANWLLVWGTPAHKDDNGNWGYAKKVVPNQLLSQERQNTTEVFMSEYQARQAENVLGAELKSCLKGKLKEIGWAIDYAVSDTAFSLPADAQMEFITPTPKWQPPQGVEALRKYVELETSEYVRLAIPGKVKLADIIDLKVFIEYLKLNIRLFVSDTIFEDLPPLADDRFSACSKVKYIIYKLYFK